MLILCFTPSQLAHVNIKCSPTTTLHISFNPILQNIALVEDVALTADSSTEKDVKQTMSMKCTPCAIQYIAPAKKECSLLNVHV